MLNDSEVIFRETEAEQGIRHFYHAALELHLPAALWRFPREARPRAIVDLSGDLKCSQSELSQLKPGFLISPFDNAAPNCTYLIGADLLLGKTGCNTLHSSSPFDARQRKNKAKFEARFLDLSNGNASTITGQHSWHVPANATPSVTNIDKNEYCRQIGNAVQTIASGALRKVVMSRAVEIDLQPTFHPATLFNSLCASYPNAFVSLVSLPGVGTWIGATPELLLNVKQNNLTAVALAGTRPVTSKDTTWAKEWGDKEIVEQEIVSEYIRDAFAQQGINDFEEQTTESLRIGNLLHLQTRFSLANLTSRAEKIVENMLNALHPTPAVCGVPKAKALAFISEHEAHNREFYAGYLGPVNLDRESHLYVNLRCMQVLRSTAILYAGGGVTIDSEPEKEWLETELKLDALRKVLDGKKMHSFTDKKNGASKILCYD